MNNIDPDKIIPAFSDCLGTCKTPVGCTCGKREPKVDDPLEEEDSHLVMKASPVLSQMKLVSTNSTKEKDAKMCSCGKNPGGACGCSSSGGGGCCSSNSSGGGCCKGKNKLEVYDWMDSMPDFVEEAKMVEVQFKNTRKGYYLNSANIDLNRGDIVAVEASPGHDIGEVTLTGKLVQLQMLKNNYRGDTKRVYRLAKPNDIEKYEEAKKKEHKTMLRAREIAEELGLAMKISDVEYQGDGNKSIFYYIADERVDFRQLIKVYASEFRVKIEMKQIGARQEAGRVGGIGPCGRELCCSSSMSNFVSVSTSAARLQDIPLNPQKLAGQCGKLKCCLNFEVDVYVEAQRKLPSREIPLETKDSTFYHFKTDVLSGVMTYSTDKHFAANLVTLPKDRVHEIIRMNKRGTRPQTLKIEQDEVVENASPKDILDDSLTRFDSDEKSNGRNNRRNKNGNGRNGDRRNNNSGNNNGNGDRKDRSPKSNGVTTVDANRMVSNNQRLEKNKDAESKPENNRRNRNKKPNNESKPTGGSEVNNKSQREARENQKPQISRLATNAEERASEGNGNDKPNKNPRRNNRNRRRPSPGGENGSNNNGNSQE